MKRRLELPSTGWLRKYRVRVNGNPMEPDLEPLRKGIVVEGEAFQPMSVVLDRIQGANAWLTIGLREGRNREIRRAMSAIGLTVNRLIRLSYGPFRLNDLKPGEVEEIKPRVLKEQLGLGDLEFAESKNPSKAPARPARGPKVTAEGKPTTRVRANPQTRGEAAALRHGIDLDAKPRPAAKAAKPAPRPRKPSTRNAPPPGKGPKRGE